MEIFIHCLLRAVTAKKMRRCAYPGCGKHMTLQCGVSFHRLPLHDVSLLQQWLLVLQIPIDTPISTLRQKDLRVCGAHFNKDDMLETAQDRARQRTRLQRYAVPKALDSFQVRYSI